MVKIPFVVVGFLILCCGIRVKWFASDHKYKARDHAPLHADKASTFHDLGETRRCFYHPFCSPAHVTEKKRALGEVMNSDCLLDAPYKLDFLTEKDSGVICKKKLLLKEVAQFWKAVAKDYCFQMYYDDFPSGNFLGRLIREMKLKETGTPFHGRMEKHQKFSLWTRYLEIHWLSTTNSCAIVLLLPGFLATILLCVHKNYFVNSPKKPFAKLSVIETGHSSDSKSGPPPITCKICMEPIHSNEIFMMNLCQHIFCSNCIVQHIVAKIQENVAAVQCPELGCKELLQPESCQAILPSDVFERWGRILCELLILEPMKFYCPFKDCSGLLVDEREETGNVILESECPHCRRLFCAKCKVPWHSGMTCKKFQKLQVNERTAEDLMLINLAEKKNWQRCPHCRITVERVNGCLFMKCRCGCCFCYHCGGRMKPTLHYCPTCKR